MTNNTIIIEKLREMKEGIFSEVIEQINKIESISSKFKYTDLKIHNVSYYLYQAVQQNLITESQADNIFTHICELEYEYFQEWEKENLNYVERSYINRTSSFYYDSNWYGNIVENGTLEELLEGNKVLKDSLNALDYRTYKYLIENELINGFNGIELDELDDLIDEENEFLESLSSDLDTVLEIVEDAKKAYDYLKEYKTKENEYALAENYLEYEITEYIAPDIADTLFNKMLNNIEKLNDVKSIDVDYYLVDNQKVITLKVNDVIVLSESFESTHKYSNLLMETTVSILKDMCNDKFNL